MKIEIYGYEVKIDYTKNINEQNLLKETRVLLSLIYRDYCCNKEKREKLIEEDKIQLKRYEQEMKEKYNPDNIFESRKQKIMDYNNKNIQLIEYKEKRYQKLFDKILKLFRRH